MCWGDTGLPFLVLCALTLLQSEYVILSLSGRCPWFVSALCDGLLACSHAFDENTVCGPLLLAFQKPLKTAVNVSSLISRKNGEGGRFSMVLENGAAGK